MTASIHYGTSYTFLRATLSGELSSDGYTRSALPPKPNMFGPPLEDGSQELIAWLESEEGEKWSASNHYSVRYHALIEDHDDISPCHQYGGLPVARHTGDLVYYVCTCMTTEDGIPEEVVQSDLSELVKAFDKISGEIRDYSRSWRFNGEAWNMRTPATMKLTFPWSWPTGHREQIVEDRSIVF